MARNRDGQFHALEPRFLPPEAPRHRALDVPEHSIHLAVGTKLLEGWLANRSQTLLPHTLNFRLLTQDQTALLLSVMAASVQADGQVDGSEARQLSLALDRVGAGQAEARELERAVHEPQALLRLLTQVQEAGLATHAYAAALLSINQRKRANRAFLDYLAARLGLSLDVVGSLKQRYRA